MLDRIEDALEDLRAGKSIIVVDDENRENEGDIICAAEFATLENVNLMAAHARGLICMPMSQEYIEKLDLPQMCSDNTDNHCTAFTVFESFADSIPCRFTKWNTDSDYFIKKFGSAGCGTKILPQRQRPPEGRLRTRWIFCAKVKSKSRKN